MASLCQLVGQLHGSFGEGHGVFVVTPGAVVEEAILGYVRLTHGHCERAVETLALSGGSAQKFVNLAGFLW